MPLSRRSFAALLTVAGVVSVSNTLCAQNWADPANWATIASPKIIRDIVYYAPSDPGYEPKSELLDVYQNTLTPAGHKAPVLIYFHGGGWKSGDRPKGYSAFRGLIAAGFSVVTVTYRTLDVAPAPGAVQDARCALSWVKANAANYNFDPDRVVTTGVSAGAQLALMAAFLPADNDIDYAQCKSQPHVVAVLDYYGPYQLERGLPGATNNDVAAHWMGDDPKPSLNEMLHKMSPATYVRPNLPPVFMAQGDADHSVPYAASVTLQQELTKAGVKNFLDTVPGGGHGQWTPEENKRVELDSLKFLKMVGVIQ